VLPAEKKGKGLFSKEMDCKLMVASLQGLLFFLRFFGGAGFVNFILCSSMQDDISTAIFALVNENFGLSIKSSFYSLKQPGFYRQKLTLIYIIQILITFYPISSSRVFILPQRGGIIKI
jgi:hypothetical protein